MKSWQLYDSISNCVVAESNDYMELDIIRDILIKNKNNAYDKFVMIDYSKDNSQNINIKGQYIICNEKSTYFKK